MSKPLPGQLDLFTTPATEGRELKLNSTVEDQDKPRLRKQHDAILDRLREGPATNIELGRIAQRFSARLEEMKRAGYEWGKRKIKPGVNEYFLIGE